MPSPCFGADLGAQHVAAEILHRHVVLQELLLHLARIGRRKVDLVDGHHQGHPGVPGVTDGLHGLRHHGVVGGDHEDHDIRDIGTSGPHGREGRVPRGVQEGDGLSLRRARRGRLRYAG